MASGKLPNSFGLKSLVTKPRRLLCLLGIHKWAYQRESVDKPGIGPNRACFRCYAKHQTWKDGRWLNV